MIADRIADLEAEYFERYFHYPKRLKLSSDRYDDLVRHCEQMSGSTVTGVKTYRGMEVVQVPKRRVWWSASSGSVLEVE